nr:MAG TPA: BovA [Bacteriophage sp.]
MIWYLTICKKCYRSMIVCWSRDRVSELVSLQRKETV